MVGNTTVSDDDGGARQLSSLEASRVQEIRD